MGQDYIDSAKAWVEAERVATEARQNLKLVFLSLRHCLNIVRRTRQMLEVDPECICVVNTEDNGESKWEERKWLHEAAESTEFAIEGVFDTSLVEIEATLAISDAMFLRPNHPPIVGDDDLLWCDRVCVHEKVDMDSAFWCTTPPTILELVFARLPLPQIFQLRGLSKQWRASIMSPSFQNAFSAATTSRRVAIVAGPLSKGLWTFGTREKKWFTLPFDFLPSQCNNPVAGDGGLLCCRRQGLSKHTKELYVCNPLTQAWRKLPLPLRVQSFDLLHLVTNKQTKQYTITVVSDNLQQNEHCSKAVVEVYNSARRTWSVNSAEVFQSGGKNNLFYYKKYVEEKFVGIRAYDKTTGYSTSIPFDFLDDIISSEMTGFFPLTEHQGQIYMLRTDLWTCGVWVLCPPSHVWRQLCHVPKPDVFKYYLLSLFVSSDAIIIFGDQRVFHDDDMEMEFYEDFEVPKKPYFWMLDRDRETWLDVANDELDYLPWSQIMFEMRLDAIP